MNNLERVTARRDGHHHALLTIRTILLAISEEAERSFMLARETDSNYEDPRTDYYLGRRDAVRNLLSITTEELNRVND